MEKVKVNFDITVEIKWEYPKCGHKNENKYYSSPYTAIAEDSTDEMCDKCKEFYTMDFYGG